MTDNDRDILDSGFKLSPLIKQVLAESQATETDDLAGEVFDRIARHDRDMALFQALRSLVRESWRPAFIPTQQTVRSEQREQTVAPERDGRQWMTADGRVAETREEVQAAAFAGAGTEEEAEASAVESEAAQMYADEIGAGASKEVAEKRVQQVVQATWERREQWPVERPAPPARLTPIRSQRPLAPPPRPQQSPKVAAIREAWRKALRQRIATGQGHKFLADCTVVDLEYAADQREQHAKRTQARADQLRTLAGLMRDHDAKTLAEVPATVLAAMSETLTEAAAA